MRYLVASDIHGMWSSLKILMEERWDGEDQLIILGDMVDRGPDSFSVVSHLMHAVKEEEGVIVLKGNHEDMLLNFLDDPLNEHRIYLGNGGWETIKSFLPDATVPQTEYDIALLASRMLKQYPEEIEFLRNLPLYHETEHWIFVHAGINTALIDWKRSSEHYLLWSREEFHHGTNETGKRIFFGHTPTRMFTGNTSDAPFVFACGSKVAIDGAAAFSGQLNIVHLDDTRPEDASYSYIDKLGLSIPLFMPPPRFSTTPDAT